MHETNERIREKDQSSADVHFSPRLNCLSKPKIKFPSLHLFKLLVYTGGDKVFFLFFSLLGGGGRGDKRPTFIEKKKNYDTEEQKTSAQKGASKRKELQSSNTCTKGTRHRPLRKRLDL